tara:strand:- start:1231 stop:2136 length:906 start_codon:yes stop_codon:yes gene_type:complete
MIKIYNLSIVLSFFGLWITSLFSREIEIILGFILIFSFGIMHGSNDILLINSISISNSKTQHTFFRVLVTYLLTVLSAVIIFYYLPLVGLTLFILFSAYHFGEQHWENKSLNISKKLKHIFFFIYGLLVLQLLFVLNSNDVIEVIFSITNQTISKDLIIYSFITNTIIFTLLALFLYLKLPSLKRTILKELFFLLIFTTIFEVSTLIWGFTIYFIFWHSIPSLYEQVNFIYGAFNKKNVYRYCIKALPYWLLSLIGISVVYIIFKEEKIFYAIFFSFIAAVTFPHALVINKMFLNKKTQPN